MPPCGAKSGFLNFETGRILPRVDDLAAGEPDVEFSARRATVEAERAERCAHLAGVLSQLRGAAFRRTRRVLEIGSGHGHFLEAYAQAHLDEFCLGIDYCAERSRRAARKQDRHPHGNLHFLRAEVGEFLDALPATFTFDAVFVLFPDPWPKRRHRKYRLISHRFLDRLARCTAPGALLHFRTDAVSYFAESTDVVASHPSWQLMPAAPWPFERPTVFQAKATSYQSWTAINGNSTR